MAYNDSVIGAQGLRLRLSLSLNEYDHYSCRLKSSSLVRRRVIKFYILGQHASIGLKVLIVVSVSSNLIIMSQSTLLPPPLCTPPPRPVLAPKPTVGSGLRL